MTKKILITGATDGIGLETAKVLASQGHHLLIHGRDSNKLVRVEKRLSEISAGGSIQGYIADLASFTEVNTLADKVLAQHSKLDVLINNAGVYKVANTLTSDKLDVRFMVNTIAPYLLTKKLLPLLDTSGRIVNLSSAAQAPVDLAVLVNAKAGVKAGVDEGLVDDGVMYAQSKLAITMWSAELATKLKGKGPSVVAVNPASFLGSKMVKEAYGVAGGDLTIGADILCRAALSDEFAHASGKYFDNDSGCFAAPHSDALNSEKNQKLVEALEALIAQRVG